MARSLNGLKEEDQEKNYSEKLRDPRWQKIRLQVFERDDWTCQMCDDSEKTLAVHHKYYEKGKEPWEYPLDALITLCEDCHTEEYNERKEVEKNASLYTEEKRIFLRGDTRSGYWF